MRENSQDTTDPVADEALLAVVADAVVAAHLRRRTKGDQQTGVEDIPLVYNYLDYLLLMAADGADLLIGVDGERSATLSTLTGGPAEPDSCARLKDLGITFKKAPGLHLAAVGPGAENARDISSRLIEFIGQMADARGSEIAEQLFQRISSGVNTLVAHLQAHPEQQVKPSAPNDPVWIESLLEAIADGFRSLVDTIDDEQALYLRYWGDNGWEFWNLRDRCDCDRQSSMIRQVDRTLHSGFARKTVSDGAVTVTIPGHFGSVPWLVACRHKKLRADSTEAVRKGIWWAFTAYRDNSILNTSLRLAANNGAINTLRKVISESIAFGISESDWVSGLQSRWQDLMRVYPFPELSITPYESEEPSAMPALSIGSRRYRLVLDSKPNPYFSWPTLPDRGGGSDSWGPIDQQTFDDDVVAVVRREIEQRHIRMAAQLSETRKTALRNLGHTLKNRLDRIHAYLSQLGASEMSGHMQMLQDISVVLRLFQLEGRKELLGLPQDKRSRFLEYDNRVAPRPLDLLHRLKIEWPALFTHSDSDRTVRLEMTSDLSRAVIDNHLCDADGRPCRVHEAVYRELFYELILNVRRYGTRRLSGAGADIDRSVFDVRCDIGKTVIGGRNAVTLTNSTAKPLPAWLESPEWKPWPEQMEHDGPGMAIALLRQLELGDMYFRRRVFGTERSSNVTVFSVATVLDGLTID
ncbi:MAG: hypothetical protein H6819_02245 [Phycisphaerales bacterium]|nr:hypothetical protein [Phycisphaerales bacterium]MCB9856967.1 hypothetical protein [Phycisphaerales bacterium]MCB9861906.1 hypothetical protein [Phycisphaerales bacterium]